MATEITDARTGRPQRLATYSVDAGERALVGQRVDGVVRISDVPATGAGRSYLVEPEIASTAELEALVADYSEGREARLRADARVVLRSHGVRPRWRRAQCWIHAEAEAAQPARAPSVERPLAAEHSVARVADAPCCAGHARPGVPGASPVNDDD